MLICINKQWLSELAVLEDPGASSRFQTKLGALEVDPQPLRLRGWELTQLLLSFHGSSFQWHWTKLFYDKKENEDILYVTLQGAW